MSFECDKSINGLLDEFAAARRQSVQRLRARDLSVDDLARIGRHPRFGPVTLQQLLATWVAHDLNHIHPDRQMHGLAISR